MTYIKKRLPNIKTLKEMYEKNPKQVISLYKKYEILQGSSESIKYIEEKL